VEAGKSYMFPPEYPRTMPKVLELKDDFESQHRPVKVSGDTFITDVLMQCIKYLILLHDLCHYYDKPSSDKTMVVYWASINNLKSD
jgi:hypothetical protein